MEITAVPQNVFDTDFKLATRYSNKVKYRALKAKGGKLLDDVDEGISLRIFPSEIALLDDNQEKVLYYVQFKEKEFHGRDSVTQIKLWSDPTSSYTDSIFKFGMKITTYVFFKILLPKADMILSDAQQTQAGRRFWEKRVKDALSLSLCVFLVDQNLNKKIKIKDLDQFNDLKEKWWGDEDTFLARRLAISKKPLWTSSE